MIWIFVNSFTGGLEITPELTLFDLSGPPFCSRAFARKGFNLLVDTDNMTVVSRICLLYLAVASWKGFLFISLVRKTIVFIARDGKASLPTMLTWVAPLICWRLVEAWYKRSFDRTCSEQPIRIVGGLLLRFKTTISFWSATDRHSFAPPRWK